MKRVENSFGDVSSILIMPDQIYNNFGLLDDDENDKRKFWTFLVCFIY